MKMHNKCWMLLIVSIVFIAAGSLASAETLNTDIVVIGAGGSGLTAALTAAYGGAEVILLEKQAGPGGSTQFAEGLFGAESSIQRATNRGPTKDEAFRLSMQYNHWRANPRLVRAFINKSAETIDWLMTQGVEFQELLNNWPGGPNTWHIIKGARHGGELTDTLAKRAEETKNIKILYRTPAKKLMTDAQKKVVGVIAEDKEGKTVTINAKAVIISTGGFANNPDMLKKYTEFDESLTAVGNINKTGDGIRMAMEVGADTKGMDVLQLIGPEVPGFGLGSHIGAAAKQASNLWVNVFGERFCDEGLTLNFPFAGNAIAQQKDQTLFIIFDETAKKYMIEKGIDCSVGVYVPVTTKMTRLDKEIPDAASKGVLFVADSIGELADKMGVDKDGLVATVKEYNTYCDKGHDDLFVKDSRYLRPIRTPKYYAIKGGAAFLGSIGGIKINEKTEVLKKDFNIIPGLYATGSCTGGLYGDSYDLFSSGATFGFAINSGRIAGENALKFISK